MALLKVSGGSTLFTGVVNKAETKGEGGFTYWDVELTGSGDYAQRAYRVWVKNENLLGWLDGVPDAMSPDLIVNLDQRPEIRWSDRVLAAIPWASG